MPLRRAIKLRCPICKKPAKAENPDLPFCSERCRTIDLGKWASGEYIIHSPVTDADEAIKDANIEDLDTYERKS